MLEGKENKQLNNMKRLATFFLVLLCYGWCNIFGQKQWVIRFNDGSEAAFDINSIQEMFFREETPDTNPQLRIAFYETVPSYSIKDLQFYTDATSDTPQTNATLFANDTIINFGVINYTTAELHEQLGTGYLGRNSSFPSYAGNEADNYFISYSPNENGTDLTLRVNYTLEATDGSGEIINIKGATAQVPAKYTVWKPDYNYTYFFKIADYTYGWTEGQSVTDIFRITFDAIVIGSNTSITR